MIVEPPVGTTPPTTADIPPAVRAAAILTFLWAASVILWGPIYRLMLGYSIDSWFDIVSRSWLPFVLFVLLPVVLAVGLGLQLLRLRRGARTLVRGFAGLGALLIIYGFTANSFITQHVGILIMYLIRLGMDIGVIVLLSMSAANRVFAKRPSSLVTTRPDFITMNPDVDFPDLPLAPKADSFER